ncbi:MAG TPA: CDP-archaeol synthase [Chloroflexia bacterium]|nr:CDP-archaeol synthase [Chloroflexia bacterium]
MPEVVRILWVILPVVVAGIAQSVAIRANLMAWAARPLEVGVRLRGEPLFGANKTWRGVLIMATVTPACAWLLSFVLSSDQLPRGLAQLAEPGTAAALGLLMGLGYSLGELPNSFLKRRLGIAPGNRPGGPGSIIFYFIDQADSVAGVTLLLWVVYTPSFQVLLGLFVVGSLVHIAFDMLLYLFEVKKVQWRAEDVPAGLISACQVSAYWLCRLGMGLYPRYAVHGAQNAEIGGADDKYIIAANHASVLDAFLVSVAFPWHSFKKLLPVRYMTHDAYLKQTWQKLLMFPFGSFPARKDGDKRGLDLAVDLLDKGQTIFIFPEGKRLKHGLGRASTAKVGVAYLAARTGAKVIPVNIQWLDAEQRKAEGVRVVLHVGLELGVDGGPPDLQPVADGVLRHIYSLSKARSAPAVTTTEGADL